MSPCWASDLQNLFILRNWNFVPLASIAPLSSPSSPWQPLSYTLLVWILDSMTSNHAIFLFWGLSYWLSLLSSGLMYFCKWKAPCLPPFLPFFLSWLNNFHYIYFTFTLSIHLSNDILGYFHTQSLLMQFFYLLCDLEQVSYATWASVSHWWSGIIILCLSSPLGGYEH